MGSLGSVDFYPKGAVSCVETHTVGMPSRIVTKGYPALKGTLLEQKSEAAGRYDHIRKCILSEPRGHSDMFGAILRPNTELTESGRAHMGVLYIHNGGYSQMCGHATIAVSRVLVDTHDPNVFPRRHLVEYDSVTQTSRIFLHTLAGLVEATVPTTSDGQRSDPTRPITLVAVPAYAIATSLNVTVPPEHRWPELGNRTSVNLSLAYCSAISCQTELHELGFSPEIFRHGPIPFSSLKHAAQQLRKTLDESSYQKFLRHPVLNTPAPCFGVLVADKSLGERSEGSKGVETGIYIFGDDIVDRSPTGSVSAARNAVAFAKGDLGPGGSWTYHSLLSNSLAKKEGFNAKILSGEGRRKLEEGGYAAGPVSVEVQGFVYYTGFHTFVVEDHDPLGHDGFTLGQLS